jgi:hypothetical protein
MRKALVIPFGTIDASLRFAARKPTHGRPSPRHSLANVFARAQGISQKIGLVGILFRNSNRWICRHLVLGGLYNVGTPSTIYCLVLDFCGLFGAYEIGPKSKVAWAVLLSLIPVAMFYLVSHRHAEVTHASETTNSINQNGPQNGSAKVAPHTLVSSRYLPPL